MIQNYQVLFPFLLVNTKNQRDECGLSWNLELFLEHEHENEIRGEDENPSGLMRKGWRKAWKKTKNSPKTYSKTFKAPQQWRRIEEREGTPLSPNRRHMLRGRWASLSYIKCPRSWVGPTCGSPRSPPFYFLLTTLNDSILYLVPN